MSTSFSSLPIISLSALSKTLSDEAELLKLAAELDNVFSTTGFAYLTDLPLNYTHEDVFGICEEVFGVNGISVEEKMKLAKKTFVPENKNTYRG
jgi:isopenicillin N synthase-like dioxygenase